MPQVLKRGITSRYDDQANFMRAQITHGKNSDKQRQEKKASKKEEIVWINVERKKSRE